MFFKKRIHEIAVKDCAVPKFLKIFKIEKVSVDKSSFVCSEIEEFYKEVKVKKTYRTNAKTILPKYEKSIFWLQNVIIFLVNFSATIHSCPFNFKNF